MPHADSALVPTSITSRTEFWSHVHEQLASLLDGQRNWVSNLANASSLIYNSLLAFPEFGRDEKAVNWCGFYIDSRLHPIPKASLYDPSIPSTRLLLGPFSGKPACQFIHVAPGKAKGVCADAFCQQKTVIVHDVEQYPGHIACDGDTKSEIVLPLSISKHGQHVVVGVLDLDCLALNGFNTEDKVGLEKLATLISEGSDWY